MPLKELSIIMYYTLLIFHFFGSQIVLTVMAVFCLVVVATYQGEEIPIHRHSHKINYQVSKYF